MPRIPDGASPQEIASLLDAAMEGTRCVGVDPGKLELAVATDPTRAAGSGKIRTVRYTAAQRRAETRPGKFDLKRRRAVRDEDGGEFRNEARRQAAEFHAQFVRKPSAIAALERTLSDARSTSSGVAGFGAYLAARARVLAPLLQHYAQPHHRKNRWHTWREGQRSVARFAQALLHMRRSEDEQLVVGWGAWGMVAGRPGQAVNRGNPPCIGVGLLKRVAQTDGILVVKVPEHKTSKTCCRCGGACGRHAKVEKNRVNNHPWWKRQEIRGLRLCTNSECCRPLNRDANAAVNIGANLMLLLNGLPPVASMSTEEAGLTLMEAAASTHDS